MNIMKWINSNYMIFLFYSNFINYIVVFIYI